ncbi:DUF4249 domain-containing protein [Mucilaginibacter sp.]|uniref:DUF4249 domain-containing protein n=1 Tax=Mucilaginibacter sp. TaxID=1882438 RepID=UPI003D12EF36
MGCKKPYNPPATSTTNSYLVVEGVINTQDSTIIKLSRTVNLTSISTTNPVNDAAVTIESDANQVLTLSPVSSGYYALGGVTLDNTRKYRLRIKLSTNQEYLSDFVEVKVTPPIDSLGYAVAGKGVQIYANTHDPKNNTHYYRFDYAETWQFHSRYFSAWLSNGTAIVPRTPQQDIYHCFGNDKSSTIVLGSSAKLTQDVLFQNPITTVDSTSEKVETRYSIIVYEYALTADAYKFWDNLKKNTEQLGSIFDAQPSQSTSNIHNTGNAQEPVVGYISACTVQSKRIFIDNTKLPQQWRPAPIYSCEEDSVFYKAKPNGFNQVAAYLVPSPFVQIPVDAFYDGGVSPAGFLAAVNECVDCTLRGTKTQPAFWK